MIAALLAGLAGYRLALLLVQEDGPGAMFERLRAWAGVPRVGPQRPRPFIGGLLSCVWCCSVWTCSALFILGLTISWTAVAFVAAMGVAILADSIVRRK